MLTSGAIESLHKFSPRPVEKSPGQFEFMLPDSASAQRACQDLLQFLRMRTFLSASIDSLKSGHSGASGLLHAGPAMYWVELRPSASSDLAWLEASGFREKLFTGKPLHYETLLALQRHLLEQAENSGFPFTVVRLDSVRLDAMGAVSAILMVNKGKYIAFKGLKITGDIKLPPSFLPNYLGIKEGIPYSRARVLKLRDQIRTLQFVDLTGNPTVTFSGEEATVNLFLQKKKAGRFDFLIGLLPQPNSTDGRLLLTGSLSAAFQNALNLGERVSIELERLRPATQKLQAEAGVPYLFGTPFGAFGKLQIFKRDSAWVEAQGEIGVEYLLAGGNLVRFFWQNKSSSLQTIDTQTIISTRRLPPDLDLRQNGFGIETVFNRLDYRFNPRKGMSLNLKAVAGLSTVLRNSQIEQLQVPNDPGFRFSTLYDSIAGQATRFQIELNTAVYLPLFVRSTFKIGFQGSGIFSSKPIFTNEQFRIGGTKVLRGFNEESLFATRFGIAVFEYRLLLGLNSYASLFSDLGYLENITDRTHTFLRPFGMGVGMNFETKAGIFGISIAVGRQDAGQSIDFRSAKFHLGYVSLF
jgi:outer membrane protein assembly factor BamA